MQVAAEHAASVSETTKIKIQEFDPVLELAQENYRRTLLVIDARLEEAGENVTTAAQTVRDVVAKPAFAAASFVAGLAKRL